MVQGHETLCMITKQHQLETWNDTVIDYSCDKTLVDLFEEQVEKTPDATAVVFEEKQLTYLQLNTKANQLAHYLQRLGVRPETLVGICLERSLETIIGLLGILKAGGAYLPLDPAYPTGRLAFMLEDAQVPVLLTQSNQSNFLNELSYTTKVIYLDTEAQILSQLSAKNLINCVVPMNLAYVIYTSGSTGKPKGVLVNHFNVTRLFAATQHWFHFNEQDVWTLFHSYAFDFSVWEIWGALIYGGRLVVVSYQLSRSPDTFYEMLCKQGVTILNQTPSAFRQLIQAEERIGMSDKLKLRFIIFGGEALEFQSLKPWFDRHGDQKPQLVNMYGITETTVHVTYRPLTQADLNSAGSLIGIPIPDLSVYILDSVLQPTSIGIPGELYVGGAGLARGYLNRPELTTEKFIPNPFSDDPQSRLYKTGDLACYLSDGSIEYLGRIDNQIKIRGFRIELGEIEALLTQHPAVQESVVVVQEDNPDNKRLIAYLVPDQTHAFPVLQQIKMEKQGVLRDKLLYELPNGMTITYLNRNETEFVYQEIFEQRDYLKNGITLNNGDCVFDVGANIGLFTLFVTQECKNINVYAFEPIPPVFELLRLNTEIHGLNVKLFECGLSNKISSDTFTYYPHVSVISGRFADAVEEGEVIKSFLLKQQEHDSNLSTLSKEIIDELLAERLESVQFTCQLRTISEIISKYNIEQIALLKIDVEKSELEVLSGIKERDWCKIKQIIVEVHNINGRLETIYTLLKSKGYELTINQEILLKETELYNIYAIRSPVQSLPTTGTSVICEPPARMWHGSNQLIKEVRGLLKEKLPDYMLPATYVMLEALPLTPNGKIDRQALPSPDFSQNYHLENYVAPHTTTETLLVTIWSQVLKREPIGSQDNFFELGGHSLLATQVISRIREAFQIDLSLAYLFDNPTITNLAQSIDSLCQTALSETLAMPASEGKASTHTLSISQQSFWLFEQLYPQTPTYHIPFAFKLTGILDISALERALSEMVRRHTTLRTIFELDDNNIPIQRIAPPYSVTVNVQERKSASVDEVKLWLTEAIRQPFDLGNETLLKVTIWLIGKQEQILLLLFHHLITDGWSVGLFIKELNELYAVSLKNQILPKDSHYQYIDFCRWQTQWLTTPLANTQLAYWQMQLATPLPVLELPTDYPRPPIQTYRGARQVIVIAPTLTQALRQLSHQHSVTLFMTLLAAFKTLLYRYTGQPDLLVGTATAGRQRVEWEQVLGLFINTLILRSQAAGSQPFTTFLHQVRDVALAAYQHQDLSYQILIDKLHPERSLSYNPLFQTFFLLQNFAWPNLELTGLTTTPIAIDTSTAKFDLTLELYERADYLEGWFEYNTDLFNASTIQRLEKHLQTLLASIVANPEQSLSRLQILTVAERNQLRDPPKLIRPVNSFIEFTQAEIEQSIPERFAQQVNKYPHHLAVKTPTTQLTYQQLHQQANRVAQALLPVVNSEPPHVALLFEHDAAMIVAIMGVLNAGLTYVPLTPDLPFQRLLHILQDSQAQVLLTHNPHSALAQELTPATSKLINIDDLKATSVAKLPVTISPDTHAYLLYTSGTTGQPKGVIQNHRNVLHFIRNYTNNLHINTQDRLSLLSTYSFDAAVMDIFAALLNGAILCPINLKDDYQAYSLKDLIRQQGITIYHSTPTVYRHFISTLIASDRFPKIRLIVMGGEEVHQTDWVAYQQYFANHCLFVNGFGPTESTVTLQYFLNKHSINSQPTVPVGYPVAATEISLLDENGDVTELYGEIAIKSDYIALGYWQQPDLTQAAFPLDQNQRRYYRTGDLGRLRADGSMEFNGRKDSQVKLRGYRIELSEIEAILQQHPAVKESTAMIREDQPGLQQLVAYIVPPAEDLVIPSSHEFRQFLKEKLPDYMVPSAIMILNVIPLLPNGKVNYHQLPIPVIESTTFVAPRNELEQRLGQIWEQLLNISTIGIHDNFFNLGGHSLLAVTLVNHIDKQFGKRLPLVSLFQAPTIAKQAELLQEQPTFRSWSVLNAIQPLGSRPILFFLCPTHYVHNLSQVLGTEQPIYRLEILGLQSSHQQIFSLEIVTKRFIQEIQSLQPQGPYYIFGFCGLAKMAIELARQLQEQGHSIALLGLIQAVPYYPRWSFSQHWSQLQKIGPIYLWRKLTRKFKWQKKRLTLLFSSISKIPDQQPKAANLSPQLEYVRFVNSFIDTLNSYAMPPYRGNMVLFHASEWCAKNAIQLKLAQQVAAGKIEICEIPAKAYNRLCITPHVELLGQQLQRYLEQSDSTESTHR